MTINKNKYYNKLNKSKIYKHKKIRKLRNLLAKLLNQYYNINNK